MTGLAQRTQILRVQPVALAVTQMVVPGSSEDSQIKSPPV
jgi:hypothetical protein